MSKTKLNVNDLEIVFYKQDKEEYISLTDMAKFRDSERTNYIIQNWMRTQNTIEFLGLWEQLKNPGFKSIEFDAFRNEAGSNSFTLTPKKWINATNSIGIISKSGRYGGTYAHKDIAFETINAQMIREKVAKIERFQKLKEIAKYQLSILNEKDFMKALKKLNDSVYIEPKNK